MRQVLLFGTSGNPPTGRDGHSGIVDYFVTLGRFDELWVLPVYQHMFSAKRNAMADKGAPTYEDRIEMCRLAFENYSTASCRVRVLRTEQEVYTEIQNSKKAGGASTAPTRSSTYDVVQYLQKRNPDVEFSFLLGTDTYQDLRKGKWRKSAELMKMVSIVIVDRLGVRPETEDLLAGIETHHPPMLTDVSSTKIRNARAEDLVEGTMAVESSVLRYMKDHRLYGFGRQSRLERMIMLASDSWSSLFSDERLWMTLAGLALVGRLLPIMRGLWGFALLALLVLVLGSTRAEAAKLTPKTKFRAESKMTDRQTACCSRLFWGDPVVAVDELPKECLQAREFVCPHVRDTISLAGREYDGELEVKRAYQHQVDLRRKAGCDSHEWEERCPHASTMLLASTGAGCSAAGCVAVEGVSDTAVMLAGDGADEAILRAVTAQQVGWLRSGGNVRKLNKRRKQFAKEEKSFLRQLQDEQAKVAPPDVENIARLVEVAYSKGFTGRAIDDARKALATVETGHAATMSYARSIAGKALSALATIVTENRRITSDKDVAIRVLVSRVRALEREIGEKRLASDSDKTQLQARLAAAGAQMTTLHANVRELQLKLAASLQRAKDLEETLRHQLLQRDVSALVVVGLPLLVLVAWKRRLRTAIAGRDSVHAGDSSLDDNAAAPPPSCSGERGKEQATDMVPSDELSAEPEESRPRAATLTTSSSTARARAGARTAKFTVHASGVNPAEEGARRATRSWTLGAIARGLERTGVPGSCPGFLEAPGRCQALRRTVAPPALGGATGACVGEETGLEGTVYSLGLRDAPRETAAMPAAGAIAGGVGGVVAAVRATADVPAVSEAEADPKCGTVWPSDGAAAGVWVEGAAPPAAARSSGHSVAEGKVEWISGMQQGSRFVLADLDGARREAAEAGGEDKDKTEKTLCGALKFALPNVVGLGSPIAAELLVGKSAGSTARGLEGGAAAGLAVGSSGKKGAEPKDGGSTVAIGGDDNVREEVVRQAGGAGNPWPETPRNGFGGAAGYGLPNTGGLWAPVDSEVAKKGAAAGSWLTGTPTTHCVVRGGRGAAGPLDTIPEDAAEEGAGAAVLPPDLDAWLRKQLSAEVAKKEQDQRQLEAARIEALTGISRYAEVEWRRGRGDLRALFLESTTHAGGPEAAEAAAFAQEVLVTPVTDRLSVVSTIGAGLCGRIDEVAVPGRDGKYALKRTKKEDDWTALYGAVVEMKVLARLAQVPHPKVLSALAIDDRSWEMPILMRRADCDLGWFICNDAFSANDRLRLVMDLVEGTQHLHSLGLIHRDIKPGNVLVFDASNPGERHAELADFGFTREVGEMCPGNVGTPGYMPLECQCSDSVQGAPAQDVFAVAMVLLMACLRKGARVPNLYSMAEFRTLQETVRIQELHERLQQGEDAMMEMMQLEFAITRRTTESGSLLAWLSADKLDSNVRPAQAVVNQLPSYLTNDLDGREDMGSLQDLVLYLTANTHAVVGPSGGVA
eukprot:g6826.t1